MGFVLRLRSGWVRDNLGELAPKIYLGGWLELSPHHRRMLEERNVVPIDIANHPLAYSWPDHLRHRYAVEWILHTLERGCPYDVTRWPLTDNQRFHAIPEYLQPVEEVISDKPIEEPKLKKTDGDISKSKDQVRTIVQTWKHNREKYPGWLIIPPNKYLWFELSVQEVEQEILKVLPELPPIEKLSVLRELIWRLESLLEPLSEQVEVVAQNILNNIDCQTRKIGGIEEHTAKWVEIRENWRELALALLTTARQCFDRDTFNSRLEALHPFLDDHPDIAQRVHHEKCLWALYTFDFVSLDNLLKEWRPDSCSL